MLVLRIVQSFCFLHTDATGINTGGSNAKAFTGTPETTAWPRDGGIHHYCGPRCRSRHCGFQLFGQVVRSQTAAMAKELAGEDGTAESQQAQSAANLSSGQTESKSLQSFTGNAAQAGGQ